jgi:hypothetical protein
MLGGFKKKGKAKNDLIVDQVTQNAANVMLEMLYEAEDYMAAANIIIMLVAMKKTFGDLKTLPKRFDKLLDEYNIAAEYVDEKGVYEAYKELSDEFNFIFDFDDGFDISSLQDNKPQENIKMRLNHHKKSSQ